MTERRRMESAPLPCSELRDATFGSAGVPAVSGSSGRAPSGGLSDGRVFSHLDFDRS